MKGYDVVVIGSGLGGLSAATFLSKEGKKVLLLERHNVPGGYASSFMRGRFEFEVSLHELSGMGDIHDRGPLFKVLHAAGVTNKVEFIPVPEFYRSVFPDFEITVPIGRENFEDTLCDWFPADADGIRRFSQVIFDFTREAVRANRVGMKAVMKETSEYPTLVSNFGKTLSEVMNPLVKDERARAVLGQIWGYFCQPPSKLAFTIYAMGVASYLRFGPYQIKGKSQALSQAFIDTIEENGGEAWFNNGAARILVKDGEVSGVVTEDGTEISCPYVVSNTNPFNTCIDLIGTGEIPSWYLKRLGALSGGASTFNVYMGLDCPYTDIGLRNHETFVNTIYDLDKHYEIMKKALNVEPAEAAVTAYNAVDPDFSPPGTASVVLTLISYAEPWLKLSPAEYIEAKNKVADNVMKLAERVAPDLREHIEVVEVATPLTNMRYTGNIGGSIIGFDETFTGTGMDRMPNRGPIPGLYFAGAYVFIGGGYEPSMVSGFQAAREVLEDMEKGGRTVAQMEKLQDRLGKQAPDAVELRDATVLPMKKALLGLHPKRVSLKVTEIIEETESAKTLRFESREDELPYFRAGQYVNLFVDIDGVSTSRPYSISSAPGKPYWDLTVRRMKDGFVSGYLLDRVKVGDVFESTGPSGSFYHDPLMDTDDLVLLAGGSGITPFASIIREAAEKKPPFKVHLIYGSRDTSDIIFEAELKDSADSHPSFRADFVISEPAAEWAGPCGFLDAEMISSLVGSLEGKTFYICGPEPMYPLCEGALKGLGVPARLVRKEVYGPPAEVTEEPGWPGVDPESVMEVVEVRSGRAIKAMAGEPLMNSLEREGLAVSAICRAGECTACRTRLLEGKVFTPERVRLRWSDERAGYIHPCMSYPLENLRIRI